MNITSFGAVGHGEKHNIGRMICEAGMRARGHAISIGGDIHKNRPFASMSTANAVSRTRPFLKIQDGCNNRCAYCRVPLARGNSVSIDPELAAERIRHFEEAGYGETVITGR